MNDASRQNLYLLAADAVLLLHALFVAFVVIGLALILVGGARSWSWVRNPWFRSAHGAAIGVVVLQAWLGLVCPLTTLESALRARGGQATYSESFVAHWVGQAVFYDAPEWVFALCYTLFGGLVAASWYWVRPRRLGRGP